jgi:hypothetical protein
MASSCQTEGVEVGSQDSPLVNAPLAPLDTVPPHRFSVGVCTGVLNTNPNLGEVGACLTSGPASRCTGTLVAPNLVLTARHCAFKVVFEK